MRYVRIKLIYTIKINICNDIRTQNECIQGKLLYRVWINCAVLFLNCEFGMSCGGIYQIKLIFGDYWMTIDFFFSIGQVHKRWFFHCNLLNIDLHMSKLFIHPVTKYSLSSIAWHDMHRRSSKFSLGRTQRPRSGDLRRYGAHYEVTVM